MTASCSCPPGDCHGGHTIDIGPARLTDEQLRRLTEYVHPDETTDYVRPWLHSMAAELLALRARITELEAAQPAVTSETSDGYHTFAELYHYRMLYNAALFNEWARAGRYDVHKSWRHSDGEECFGGGWFVVYAQLPSGQISNHYEATHWDLFRIPERETGAEWDGHTPQQAAERLAAFLESAAAQREPTSHVHVVQWKRFPGGNNEGLDDIVELYEDWGDAMDKARALRNRGYSPGFARIGVHGREVADQLTDQSTTQTGSTDGQAAK